jgi:hypothetical protein
MYFILASLEATLRVLHPVNGPSSNAVMAGIPLSVLDAGICWWIFQSLLTTTRTLRLRRFYNALTKNCDEIPNYAIICLNAYFSVIFCLEI